MSDLLHGPHDRHREFDADADEKTAKRLRRAERALETRPLGPWERYRALTDVLDSYMDMVEIADRKARFALLILGALNALNIALLVRPQFGGPLDNPRLIGGYAAVYIIVSLVLLTLTINTLRPRVGSFMRRDEPGSQAGALGVRFIGDVVIHPPEQYYDRWLNVEVGEVNRELASQVHMFGGINVAKYRALGHVYNGLIGLALLTALFLVAIIAARVWG